MTFKLIRQANGWRIDDISSPNTPSLVAFLGGGTQGVVAKPMPWPNSAELTALHELIACRSALTNQLTRASPDRQYAAQPTYRLYRIPEPAKFPEIPVHSFSISRGMAGSYVISYANMDAQQARAWASRAFPSVKLNKQQLPNWKAKKQSAVPEGSAYWIMGIKKGDTYQQLEGKGLAGWDFTVGLIDVDVYDKGILKITCTLPDNTIIPQ